MTESSVPLLDTELSALDDRADSLMFAIQENERNADAIVELAYLYLRCGWHERAIGPLARAAELEAGRDDLKYELQLALKLSGTVPETANLVELAKEFVALVEMWGGC